MVFLKLKIDHNGIQLPDRSKTYVKKILEKINGEYFKNYKIKKIAQKRNGMLDFIMVHQMNILIMIKVVLLHVHADEVLKLIENPTEEKKILKNLNIKKILHIYIHDERLMPNKKMHGQVGILYLKNDTKKNCVTYWLNKLQNLKLKKIIF